MKNLLMSLSLLFALVVTSSLSFAQSQELVKALESSAVVKRAASNLLADSKFAPEVRKLLGISTTSSAKALEKALTQASTQPEFTAALARMIESTPELKANVLKDVAGLENPAKRSMDVSTRTELSVQVPTNGSVKNAKFLQSALAHAAARNDVSHSIVEAAQAVKWGAAQVVGPKFVDCSKTFTGPQVEVAFQVLTTMGRSLEEAVPAKNRLATANEKDVAGCKGLANYGGLTGRGAEEFTELGQSCDLWLLPKTFNAKQCAL